MRHPIYCRGETKKRWNDALSKRPASVIRHSHGRNPPGILLELWGVLRVGLGSVVSRRADAAAECWAFLMLGPSASQYWSPSVSRTENIWGSRGTKWRELRISPASTASRDWIHPGTLEWAGPCSQSSLYSGWILLKRANSFTKHMGVFSLGFAMLGTVTYNRYNQMLPWGKITPLLTKLLDVC